MDEEDELFNLPEDTATAAISFEAPPAGIDDDISNLPEDTAFGSLLEREAEIAGTFTPAPVQNIGQYLPEDFGKYKQDYNITLPGQLDDLAEYRGATQTTIDKWGNGAVKFVGKTGVNILGAIPGLGAGLFSAASAGKWSEFYNNDFAKGLDGINEWFDESLPNHYTEFEREKGLWDQMGTANFWSDKFLNGMSFLAGAVASEFLMSGLTTLTLGAAAPAQAAGTVGLLARGTRLFKNASLGRKATDVAKAAGQFVSRRQLLDTGKLIRQLGTGAMYEAGVEARHSYDEIKNNLVTVALQDKGLDPYTMTKEQKFDALSVKERQDIEETATDISNGVFAGNVALVGMSNMLMIPKLYGVGKHALIRKIPGVQSLDDGMKFAGHKLRKFTEGKLGKTAADLARGAGYVGSRALYEGVIEEGGQGIMQRAGADYALLSGIRDTDTLRGFLGASIDSFTEGTDKTFHTTEGLTEVTLGAIMGALGLPGVNTTVVQAYRDTKVRRQALDYIDKAIEENPGLQPTLSSYGSFFMNVAKRSALMDEAVEAGDMALVKDLEHDNFFDYVMAKIHTGQYEDIANQNQQILDMSEEEFIEWGGYTSENLSSDEVTARKTHVVNAVKERAKQILEKTEKVDANLRYTDREKYVGMDKPGTKAFNRKMLIHSLSVMDNAEEREEAMIRQWAEYTGGTVGVPVGFRINDDNTSEDLRGIESMPVIEYTDKEGNIRSVDIGAFTEEGNLRGQLASVMSGIQVLEGIVDRNEKQASQLKTLYDLKVTLNDVIKEVGDEDMLSKEEYEELIKPWREADPEGFAKNEKEAYELLADLRKVRARRQSAAEMYKKLMDPSYNPLVTQSIVDRINALDDTVTEEEKKARKRKDEEDAKKLQEFKDKLKVGRTNTERELVNLEQKIEDLKQEIKDLLGDLVQDIENLEAGKRIRGKNGRFLSVKQANDKILEIEETIRIGESLLKDLNVDRENIYNILEAIDELEENPPNLNTYGIEMYGKTDALLKEIDPKKSLKENLKLGFLREMSLLKGEKQNQASTIEQAIKEITDELVQLNEYKSILESLLLQHRANFEEKGKLTLEEQDNVEFLASEIILTEEGINRLREIRPVDINALDSVAPFAETLSQFEDSMTKFMAFAIVENSKLVEGTDADPKRPSKNYQNSVEDAYNLDLDITDLSKADIAYPGFNKTAGSHISDEEKEVYFGALNTYREILLVEEDDRTTDEIKAFAIAESQLRYFNWLHSTNVSPTPIKDKKGKFYYNYAVAAVTINNIPDELRKLGLTEELFFDEEDIKFVVFQPQRGKTDDEGKSIKGFDYNVFLKDPGGNLIFTSALKANLKRANGKDRFRDDTEMPESEQEDLKEKHQTWRNETLEENAPVYIYLVESKSNGRLVLEDEPTQNNRKLRGDNKYSEVPLYIGTGKSIDEAINLPDIPMQVRTRSGLVWSYDNVRQIAIPMVGRNLEIEEAENVAKLLQKLLTLRQEAYEKQEEKDWGKAYTEARDHEFELDGKKITLKKALDDIIYMRGSRSSKDNPEFKLIHQKGTFLFGGQDQVIELEDFKTESDVYNSFIEFLGSKYHNINKGSIVNNGKTDGWVQVILKDDLELDTDTSVVWKNYNEYLLRDRDEGQSPLLTRVTPIGTNEDPDILDAPRSHGGELRLDLGKKRRQSLEDIRSNKGRAKATATRMGRQIRDAVNTAFDKRDKNPNHNPPNQSPAQNPNTDGPPMMDITDLQDTVPTEESTEEEPTYTPPADLQYVDMAIDKISGEKLVETLNNPEETPALKERILDRYMDGDLSNEQIEAINKSQKDDPGTTPPSNKSDNLPFLSSSYTLPSDQYIEETFGEELARLQGMLPAEVIPVLGMISGMSGEGYAQLIEFGKILVSDLAPGGALYHEGFHNVSLHMLSPRDRQKLYNIVRRTKGKAAPYQEVAKGEQDRSYKPKSKLLSEFTNKEAEEWLAEEFRRYVLSKGKYVIGQDTITPEQRSAFQKLFDFIRNTFRSLFNLDKSFDVDPDIKGIEDLFAKIEEGGFKNAQRNLENKNVGSPMMAASMILNDQSAVFTADLNSTLTSYLSQAIQGVVYEDEDGIESTLEFSDFLDMTPVKNAALSQAYRDAFILIYDDIEKRLGELKENTPAYNQLLGTKNTLYSAALGSKEIQGKVWELGVENRFDAVMLHKQFMQQMGMDIDTEDDRDEDQVSSRMFQDVSDKMEMSPTDTAKGVIKILLGTIPNNEGDRNSTGLKGAYNLKSVIRTLQTRLQGTLDFQAQLEILEDLQEDYPWAEEIINRLGEDPYTMPMSLQEALMQTAFRNQFAKTMYDTQYTVLQETGKIYTIDPNMERNLKGIRARWNASLRGKTRTSPHVKFDEKGNIVFNKDVKSKFGNKNLTVKGVFDAVEFTTDYGYKLDALEHLGIVFSGREKLEEILRMDSNNELIVPGTDTTYRDAVNNGLLFVFQDIIGGTTSLTALFDRDESLSVTRMSHLAKLELDTTNIDYEFQHQNPEGKLVYSISMNNYLSTIANIPIEQLDSYFNSKDNENKNPYAFNSLTLKALRENEGAKLDVLIREGLTIEGAGQVGVKTSKLRPTDNLASYLESIMMGVMPVLKAADISTDFSIRFPIEEFDTIESAKKALLGYLVDEIVATNTAIREKINVEDYTKNIDKLRMFKSLMSKLDTKMTTNLNAMLNDPESTRDKIQGFVTNNSDVLFESIDRVLKEDVEELVDFMEELGLISKNEDDTYQLLGLNRNRFGESLPENVSRDKIRDYAETIVARQTIYKNEMFKMFFGDPAFYNALFKRIKGTVGVKDIFNVDQGLNDWLNKSKNNREQYDDKVSDGYESIVVVKEPKRITPFINEYLRSLPVEVASEYARAADKADGTLLLTLPSYREMAIRGNAWSAQQERVYENVMNREDTITEEEMGKFPPLKFQYFGYLDNGNVDTQVPGFFKMSAAAIYPGLGKMGDKTFPGIDNMYNFLTTEKLGGLILPSAFKIGVPGESDQLDLMEDGVVRSAEDLKLSLDSSNVVNIDYRFMGTQLEVPSKFKGTSPVATQARVQVLSDLYSNGRLRTEFEYLQPSIERYNNVLNALTTQAYNQLLEDFGLLQERDDAGGVTYTVKNNDYSKFIETLKDESIRRQMPKQLLASFDRLEERNIEKRPVYFDAVSNKGRLEGVLWSLAGKRVIRQRFKGDMYVQQSSLGFETSKIKDLPGERLDELTPYKEGDKYMEVYLPHHFKEMVGKNMIVKKDGIYDGNTRVGDLDLLKLIGIRIPTDGIHSIEAIKVKSFLPRTAGPTVVIPSEMVTKSGSDFDIDKLVLYFPAYKMKGDQLVKEKFYDSLEEWYNAQGTISPEELEQLKGTSLSEALVYNFVSRIGKQSFEEWQTENPDATIYNVQSKGAMQNAVMDDMIKLLQANERYSTWMQPVHTNDLEALALELNGGIIKDFETGEETFVEGVYKDENRLPDLATITDYHLDTRIPNLIKVAEAFNKGQTLVGIEALASTHHVKGQIAGLALDTDNEIEIPTGATKEVLIRFEGFDPLAAEHSLGRVMNIDGTMRISDAISQFVNASVDVVNNPILHILNINPDNANMWTFLTRIGVDVRTQAMFANQPIIKDYLKLLEIGRSRTSKVMEVSEYDEEIAEKLLKNYAGEERTNMLFNADILKSMVGKTIEDMSPEEKSMQLQILDDMFVYSKIGESLGNIVTAQSFDTKIPKSRNHLRVILDMYESALSTGLFKNAEKIAERDRIAPPIETIEGVSEEEEYLGQPDISQVDDGSLYQFSTKDGLIAGVLTSPTEFRIDGISAFEIGKGSGTKMFEALLTYLNNNGVTTLSTVSAGEGAVQMHDKAVNKGLLTEISKDGRSATFNITVSKKGTPATFMRSMATYNYDMQTIFNDMFLTEKENTTYNQGFKAVQQIFANPNIKGLSVDDRAKVLSKYENGFISFMLQNIGDVNLGGNIKTLMLGDNSMASQIEMIQDPKSKHPLKDNPFLQNLIPVISPIRSGKDMTNDYLQPLNRTMTPFEMDVLYDGFRELEASNKAYPNLALNIIKTALLQGGVESTRDSFLNTIPGDSIMRLMEDYLDKYATGNTSMLFKGKVEDYFEYFFQNNQNNSTIVPKDTRYSKKIYPYTYKLSAKSRAEFKQALKTGAAKPKMVKEFKRNPIKNIEGAPGPTGMKGSPTLINMTNKTFLASNYRKSEEGEEAAPKNDDITCKT